jgi:hypothetical protein
MDKLWLKLQKIESDLIINNFDKENNCLTKHDAIIFIEDRKELVVKFDTNKRFHNMNLLRCDHYNLFTWRVRYRNLL